MIKKIVLTLTLLFVSDVGFAQQTEVFGFHVGDNKAGIEKKCKALNGYKFEKLDDKLEYYRCVIVGDRASSRVHNITKTQPGWIDFLLENDRAHSVIYVYYEPIPWLKEIQKLEKVTRVVGEAVVEEMFHLDLLNQNVRSPIHFNSVESWAAIHVSFVYPKFNEKIYVLDITEMTIPKELR